MILALGDFIKFKSWGVKKIDGKIIRRLKNATKICIVMLKMLNIFQSVVSYHLRCRQEKVLMIIKYFFEERFMAYYYIQLFSTNKLLISFYNIYKGFSV